DACLLTPAVVRQEGPGQDDVNIHAAMLVTQTLHYREGTLEVANGLPNVLADKSGEPEVVVHGCKRRLIEACRESAGLSQHALRLGGVAQHLDQCRGLQRLGSREGF